MSLCTMLRVLHLGEAVYQIAYGVSHYVSIRVLHLGEAVCQIAYGVPHCTSVRCTCITPWYDCVTDTVGYVMKHYATCCTLVWLCDRYCTVCHSTSMLHVTPWCCCVTDTVRYVMQHRATCYTLMWLCDRHRMVCLATLGYMLHLRVVV